MNRARINSVRASRGGHEYHKNWIARKSMQLLLQEENLVGIAVEGLSPVDELKAKSETVRHHFVPHVYLKQFSIKKENS